MILLPSKLGAQLLKSLTFDKSHWEFTPSMNRFTNKRQNIHLEFTTAGTKIYKFELNNTDLKSKLTFWDRVQLRKFLCNVINNINILNSADNLEEFI